MKPDTDDPPTAEFEAPPPRPGDWWTDTIVAWRVFVSRDFAAGLAEAEIGRSRRAFPLAALCLGAIAIAFYGVASALWRDVWVNAAFALAALAIVTGARAEIGFAAYAEAVAAQPDQAGRREAARGLPFGYAGVAALVFLALLKLMLLAAIQPASSAAAALIAAVIGSRAAMALATVLDEAAEAGDSLSGLLGAEGKRELWLAPALGAAFLLLFLGPWAGLAASAVMVLVAWLCVIVARFQFGGLTLSALFMVQQMTELALLGAAVAMP